MIKNAKDISIDNIIEEAINSCLEQKLEPMILRILSKTLPKENAERAGEDTRWMKRKTAAKYLDMSTSKIDDLAKLNILTKHYLDGGKTVRFDRRELDEFMKNAEN